MKIYMDRQTPHSNTSIHTRIDKFYISSALAPCVITTDIIPFPFSDHDLITLKIDLHNQPRGEGYWHFNNSLLDDNVFVTEIYQFWTDWLTRKKEFNTPLHWWDTAKTYFKTLLYSEALKYAKADATHADNLKIKFNASNKSSLMATALLPKLIFKRKSNCNVTILMTWRLLNTPKKGRRVLAIFIHWKATDNLNKLLNC